MTLEKVLGVGFVRHWLYLVVKPSHVGVDVDRLACPYTILWPAAVRREDKASRQTLSCLVAAVGGGAFLGDVKPSGLDIWWRIDRLGTCVTKSYTGLIVLTKACLSYVKVIMTFRRVSLV
jgi:hypothetical protein